MRRLLWIILVSFICWDTSTAQTLSSTSWEALFAKADKQLAKGRYAKALARAQSLAPTIRKKYGNSPTYLAWITVYEVRIAQAQADFERMEAKITEALSTLDGTKVANPEGYARAVAEIAEALIDIGYLRRAEELLTNAESALRENGGNLALAELAARRMVAQAYMEKTKSTAEQLPEWRKVWEQLQAPSNGEKLSKADITYRKAQLARLILLEGELLTLKGNYAEAEPKLREAGKQINALVGSSHPLYARYLAALGDNYFDWEKYSEAESQYESALKKVSNKHKIYLDLSEKLIRAYIAQEEGSNADNLLSARRKTIKALTPDESVYDFSEDLIQAEKDVQDEEYLKARTKLEELLTQSEKIIPANHPIRLMALNWLYEAYVLGKTPDMPKGEATLKSAVELAKKMYGEEAIAYKYLLVKLADYYLSYTDDFDKVKTLMQDEPYLPILDQRSPTHKRGVYLNNTVANYYDVVDKYKEAANLLANATESLKAKHGEKSLQYAEQLVKYAEIQLKVGDYKGAEASMETALPSIRKELSRTSPEYAEALAQMAKVYATIGIYDKAEDMLRSSSRIYRKINQDDATEKAKFMEEMAFLYIRIGEYIETEEILNQILHQKEARYGKLSRQLLNPLSQLATLDLIKGNYADAEKLLNRAAEIAKKVYGTGNLRAAEIDVLLARYYYEIGDYDRAQEYLEQAIGVQKTLLGDKHIELAKSYTTLAAVKMGKSVQKNATEAESLLKEARLIVQKNFDTQHPLYADALKNLGELYIQLGKYPEAFVQLSSANRIWQDKLDSKNLNSAQIYSLLGDVYARLKRFAEAEQNYEKSQAIYAKLLSREHPDFVRVEAKLGEMYFIRGDYKSANEKLDKTTAAYLKFIRVNFPALSEREKAKYWAKISPIFEFYNSLAVKQRDRNPELLGKMYNFRLATKAILLNASLKVRDRILKGKDEALKEKFKQWVKRKEELTQALSLTDEQITESQIDVGQIRDDINRLEKELSEASDLFANTVEAEEYTWESVRKALNRDECAVEIIRYREYTDGFTDKVRYAALLINQSTRSHPDLVLADNGNELEDKYLQYYRNATRFERKDKYSYTQYWQPIEKALPTSVKRIFLSPDGAYNQVNLEALLMEGEQFVIDRYDIRVVSNTKDLLTQSNKKERRKRRREQDIKREMSNSSMILLGNPKYYRSDSIRIVAQTRASEAAGGYVAELPGTETEINDISAMARNRNWKITTLKGSEAQEEFFKQMQESPRVVHIATHGFFAEKPETDELELDLNQQLLRDPLRNSGLLVAGAGDMLAKGTRNFDSESGVLTAYELMNLILDNTEVVILSACETGVGEVAVGEGVYGLQRAILVAGADALVMSLFKVNDEVTQKLMVKFYQNWLATGDKRKAFLEAQKAIKAEYPQPIYWGSFVMVGVD